MDRPPSTSSARVTDAGRAAVPAPHSPNSEQQSSAVKPPNTKPLLSEWEWQGAASCRGMDSSVFFSPADERRSERRKREEQAQAICRTCPVSRACASFALRTGQAYGVWGNLTEADRRPG